MRSAIRVRQQILLGLGGGLALAAGVACGGAVVPSDPDAATPGTGGTAGAPTTSGGGTTGGAGGSAGSGASTGTAGADPDPTGSTTSGTTGTGGTSGTTGTGGSSGGTTTGTGGSSGGTTTGTGGAGGTVGSGGSGAGTTTTTTTGTGGVGGTAGSGGSGGATTTTTGTGGTTGGSSGTGGIGGGIGGTGGTGPIDNKCPPDAGSPEPICADGGVGNPWGNGWACFSAAALARYLKAPVDGGALCALPNPCPTFQDFRTMFACGQYFFTPAGTVPENGQCCYPIQGPPVDGRPFIVDGRSRHADVIERSDWCEGQRFDLRGESSDPLENRLTPAQRARLADAWLADAQAEHASIASFARLTLQLLSLGAPPELLIATQRATGDEIKHAELCFALASRFAGKALGPSELPMVGAVGDVSLVELAVAAVHEGCVGEAMAAVLAGERLEQARDPMVRAALTKITTDEARHAELAWRTVVWAIERGGHDVYAAVRAAFDEVLAPYLANAGRHDGEEVDDELRAHGRASPATIRRVQEVVAREVVAPIAASLSTLVASRAKAIERHSAVVAG
jgi:hypothetical protein